MRRHFKLEGPDRGLRLRFDVQETRGGGVGVTLDFKWKGWVNGGKNENPPQNSLGFKQNPKNPGPKFNPPKIPRRIFEP